MYAASVSDRVRHGTGFTFEVLVDGERCRLPMALPSIDMFHAVVERNGLVEMRYGKPGAGRPRVDEATVLAWLRVPAGAKDCALIEIVAP